MPALFTYFGLLIGPPHSNTDMEMNAKNNSKYLVNDFLRCNFEDEYII